MTDANVVLGRINPNFFLGGEANLDLGLAKQAIQDKVAVLAGLGLVEAAQAVVDIANAKMTSALYFVGNLASNCGTWFQVIAQSLLVYRLTSSTFLPGIDALSRIGESSAFSSP